MPVFTTLFELLNPTGTVLLSTAGDSTASYGVRTWSRPGRPKRRVVEQGPHNDGEVELQSVLDVARLVLVVRVKGSTYADLQSKYDALIAAAEGGPDMQIRVTIAGTARTWRASGDANIDTAATDRDGDALRWSLLEEVRLDWPVNPAAY